MFDEPLSETTSKPRPSARHYAILCLLMLLALTVQFVERVQGIWFVFPLLFGLVFLLYRVREGPAILLFLIAGLLAAESKGLSPFQSLGVLLRRGFPSFARFSRPVSMIDAVLLAGTFLIYAASHYRYVSLARHVFPVDPRVRPYTGLPTAERRRLLEEPKRRSAASVAPREFVLLALGALLWVVGAAVLWHWAAPEQGLGYTVEIVLVPALKLLYLFGIPLLLFTAGLGYAAQSRSSPEESLMFLQETLWRETRREQSRANRWLTWVRLRAQRRKEKS